MNVYPEKSVIFRNGQAYTVDLSDMQSALQGVYSIDDGTVHLVNGQTRPLDSTTEDALIAKWQAAYNTDPDNEPIEPEQPSEPTAADLKNYVNKVRDGKEDGPFNVMGYSVDTDPKTQTKLAGKTAAINAGKVTGDVSWRMADDVTATLTQAEFLDLAAGVVGKIEQLYGFCWGLKADIDAGNITTYAEIDGAAWPT